MAPPNGGVYVLKNGTAVKIASPIKFVAGLPWHDNKLYISGAVLAGGRPSWRLISWIGWNGTTFTVRKTLFVAGKKFDGFALHVHHGDSYGLPARNDTAPGKCEGFTKPFRTFTPHTDLMGIAVRSGTLHLTSFAGPKDPYRLVPAGSGPRKPR